MANSFSKLMENIDLQIQQAQRTSTRQKESKKIMPKFIIIERYKIKLKEKFENSKRKAYIMYKGTKVQRNAYFYQEKKK